MTHKSASKKKSVKKPVGRVNKRILVSLIIFFVITVSLYFFYPPFYDFEKGEIGKVTRVIDGDTFEISSGEIVRLICIDAPESDEEGYLEAKIFLQDLILGKRVRLEKDVSETDKYKRLLRYAYLVEEDIFINKFLVDKGYAEVKRVKPDTKLCNSIENDPPQLPTLSGFGIR
mgnify:CR=1 FL=1